MNLHQTLQQLESLGTEQNRKVYRRHGISDNLYGVSYAHQRKLAKTIRRNHSLALELWGSGNHDARILATFVADPSLADDALLESWAADLDSYVLTDALAAFAGKTARCQDKAEQWRNAAGEWHGRAGWHLVSHLAMQNPDLPDAWFSDHLDTIEREIHIRQNRVRDAMNNALIAIGIRNPTLESLALAAAARIGKVEVDHGQTGCKTPDAAAYIQRTLARRRQKSSR